MTQCFFLTHTQGHLYNIEHCENSCRVVPGCWVSIVFYDSSYYVECMAQVPLWGHSQDFREGGADVCAWKASMQIWAMSTYEMERSKFKLYPRMRSKRS